MQHTQSQFFGADISGRPPPVVRRALAKSDDTLESITTDSITMPLLEYLPLYSRLKTLGCVAILHMGALGRNPNVHILKIFTFNRVIPRHQDTLLDLLMPFVYRLLQHLRTCSLQSPATSHDQLPGWHCGCRPG